jgi:hypothetical protein
MRRAYDHETVYLNGGVQLWLLLVPAPAPTGLEGTTLRQFIAPLAIAVVMAAGIGGQALAQGAPQTVAIMKVDPATVATGFRSSKIVGSSVVNEGNETV